MTGSGKTLAFVIPVVEILLRRDPPLRHTEPGAIIVSPTRELAQQTFDILARFVAGARARGCVRACVPLPSHIPARPPQRLVHLRQRCC